MICDITTNNQKHVTALRVVTYPESRVGTDRSAYIYITHLMNIKENVT